MTSPSLQLESPSSEMWTNARVGLARISLRANRLFSARSKSSLAYRVYEDTSNGFAPSKTAFIMHGILGNKLNWRTFSQKLVSTRPDWRFVAVDHRGHGDSPSMEAPHTIEACANDILALAEELGVEPDAILGHSFGGKIAIKYLQEAQRQSWKIPEQVWVLDSLPGSAENDYAYRKVTASIERVLPVLKKIPLPIHSKKQLIEDLQAGGIALGEAQWLTTNLKMITASPETYTWKMDVSVIEQLFESFLDVDLWPVVASVPEDCELHFVQADRSKMWTPQIVDKMRALEHQRVYHHLLPNSDHWVHIDNPNGLLEIILKHIA